MFSVQLCITNVDGKVVEHNFSSVVSNFPLIFYSSHFSFSFWFFFLNDYFIFIFAYKKKSPTSMLKLLKIFTVPSKIFNHLHYNLMPDKKLYSNLSQTQICKKWWHILPRTTLFPTYHYQQPELESDSLHLSWFNDSQLLKRSCLHGR